MAAGAATGSCRFCRRHLHAERKARPAAEAEQERCLTRRERRFEQLTGERPVERSTSALAGAAAPIRVAATTIEIATGIASGGGGSTPGSRCRAPTGAGKKTPELSAFRTLRANHEEREHAIAAVERQLHDTLSGNPGAVIEAERVAAQTSQPLDTVKEILAEVAANGGLQTWHLWRCPNGLGTTAEAESPWDFLGRIECERCGQMHAAEPGDIDEVMIATDNLRREIAEATSGRHESTSTPQPTA